MTVPEDNAPHRLLGRRGPGVLFAAAALAAQLWAGSAQGQVLIQPVIAELGARQKTVVVSLSMTEGAAAPMRMQAQVLRWRQDLEGKAVTEPADDVLVSPAIAELRPGQRQVFRVALRNPRPLQEEMAYRLVFEDVAEPPLDEAGKPVAGLHIRMRYDLPLMVAQAAKPVQLMRWKSCPSQAAAQDAGAQACVRLLNAGNRRVKIQSLRVAGQGWEQELQIKEGSTVLAGAQREWRVALPSGQAVVSDVVVQTARDETLRAESGGF
ncbi:MAG TPA: fimbria/pilus periplasmic chaperone [Ramlibacter sp.]|nr:fimbria/pilus periplasmic chaperone [Ramlibacter sp.]